MQAGLLLPSLIRIFAVRSKNNIKTTDMNISYNWLRRYLPTDRTAEQLAEILTDIGLEVESLEKVETVKGGLRGVVVGEVLTCTDHPDSDHLHITTVDTEIGRAHV